MPSGYPFSRTVRREFLDLVCQGMPVIGAERVVGVSLNTGSRWWREAGAMKLRVNAWGRGGLQLREIGRVRAVQDVGLVVMSVLRSCAV